MKCILPFVWIYFRVTHGYALQLRCRKVNRSSIVTAAFLLFLLTGALQLI